MSAGKVELNNIFDTTLKREGKTITINKVDHKVFFRRNDNGDKPQTTIFAPLTDNIPEGAEFTLNGMQYLVIKRITGENDIYQKYNCVKCNQQIKIIYSKGYFVTYNVYCDDIQRSLDVNSSAITLDSKLNLIMSLTDDAKKIDINKRLFCGSYHSAWKVDERQYQNGLLYLYCSRSAVLTNDDNINGIADRWQYEDKPANYVVSIADDSAVIDVGKTYTPTITVTKDGTAITTPVLSWTNTNSAVATIDASTNIITGVAAGNTTFTALYKPNVDDMCTTDSIAITVNKPVVICDIVVTPSYTGTYYSLTQYSNKTFTCTISGVTSPSWTITYTGLATGDTCAIDNANGTFKLTNNNGTGNTVTFTINESVSGKSKTYKVKCNGLL